MRLGAVISLVLAVALGSVAAFLAKQWLEGRAVAAISPSVPTGTIVVAAQSLGFGTQLSNENLLEIPWSAGALPEGAFATRDALLKDGRRVVLSALERNEPVLQWKVTGPGQRASLSALIDEGMKAVTVQVDDIKGVAGFVLPGDRVDVLLIRGDISDVLLQSVRVLAVDQLANEKQEKPQVSRAVTLEVNTEQAQKLVLASSVGRLSLILRPAGAMSAEESRRVTAADLGMTEFVPPEKPPELPKAVEAPPPPPVNPFALIGVVRGIDRNTYNVPKETRTR